MNNIYNNDLINKSKDFAFNLHKNHTCIITGHTKEYHLKSVVTEIRNLNINNNALIVLAYLHDTLDYVSPESRESILSEIKNIFGEHMAQLVLETTDNFKIENISTPDGMKAFEKRIGIIKSPNGITDDAAIVILAEKVCNLTGMYEAIEKGSDDYWEKMSKIYGLKKSNVKDYYEEVYDAISNRCYGNRRLRALINKYDALLYRIFC